MQDAARRGSLDRDDASISRVDRVNVGPLIHQSGTWLKGVIIMVRLEATWRHLTRRSGGHVVHQRSIKHVPI